MNAFWQMGGYGAFIWPAYIASALGLAGAVWQTLAAWRAAKKRLAALDK